MKSKESTSTTTMIDLPDELLSLILSKLSLEDKLRYECICKLWQKFIYQRVDKVAFYEKFKIIFVFHYSNWCGEDKHTMDENDLVSIKLLPIILNKCKYLRAITFHDGKLERHLIEL